MPAQVGDNVRFLNSLGGGKVVRIDQGIAYVEDEDGFEVPVQLRECVVVDPARSLGFTERPSILPQDKKESHPSAPAPAPPVVSAMEVANSIETPQGDTMDVILGFEPVEIKALSRSSFDAFLVNDSNYWLFVLLAVRGREDSDWHMRYAGLVEPNMEVLMHTFSQEDLPQLDRILVQYVAYKNADRRFALQSPASVELKVDTTKFAKLHCFRPHEYFENPVIAFDITRNGHPAPPPSAPDPRQLAQAMQTPARPARRPVSHPKPAGRNAQPKRVYGPDADPVVVDLHASEIFEDMRGLGPADILNAQIDLFSKVMDEHLRHAGQRLVFIHGKGEGVLRQALLKELNHRYQGHEVQDASFREYGFGATQVTIRPQAAAQAQAERNSRNQRRPPRR